MPGTEPAEAEKPVFSARNLSIFARNGQKRIRIVSDVSFDIAHGEFFALVGESGSGKTMIARAIMRLLPRHMLEVEGELSFQGRPLADLPEAEMRKLRGGAISMIFQEPMTSLDPLMPIGRQIEETLEIHSDLGRKARLDRIKELLSEVRFAEPAKTAMLYPHELSGGMRQRAMIAMALANNPTLLIADEPTTALDVTIQREVMEIIYRLKEKHRLSVLFISHDLSLVHQYAETVGVLYGGVLMESGPEEKVIGRSAHPYTAALLNCVPRRRIGDERRSGIAGAVPSPLEWPPGCRFKDRCEYAGTDCAAGSIPIEERDGDWTIRCLRPLT
ncbi:peptide/nickel transport system ATP-binding protein [Lutimaribacter pacificus]|uniref:Peptide/nickel transport system ATP-binding protein n=1 Tax=Lutimaribacter pacificus TaxID=391948 RepID=A0A1H0GGB9_9RHOB|nr:ABC transporter ATP-binding protein [Lutimaribacter pacificus]SDO05789.1 peptide/nickel transport system ATP-binding protein [Lutimaribacter pacificus]SHJ87903.1 peptide/nickel transport system ATP-binding protein [Lutimaribacter pacificus]